MTSPTAVRVATSAIKLQSRAVSNAVQTKAQPWKAFWPPKADMYTEAERANMPWLTWKYDPKKPTDRPWRSWMLENQKMVTRRGGM